jgi:hypothetical protein
LLADTVIELALAGEPITPESIKAACPTLDRLYRKAYSTIPTYLGHGRSNDGLQLYRVGRTGPRSPSRENAILACRYKERHGHDMEAFARERGCASYEALQDAVDALRPHAAFDDPGCGAAATADSPPRDRGPAAAAPDDGPEGRPPAEHDIAAIRRQLARLQAGHEAEVARLLPPGFEAAQYRFDVTGGEDSEDYHKLSCLLADAQDQLYEASAWTDEPATEEGVAGGVPPEAVEPEAS